MRLWYMPASEVFFLRVPRSAGGSIETWLREKTFNLSSCGEEHLHENEWRRAIATIRNPFDRLVSVYKNFVKENNINKVIQHSDVSFPQFVQKVISLDNVNPDYYVAFYAKLIEDSPNDHWDMVTRINTIPLVHSYNSVDKFEDVIRFENLNEEWLEVVQKYELLDFSNFTMLPHTNKSIGRDYWQYYDSTTRDIVSDYYKEDLLTFDYKF